MRIAGIAKATDRNAIAVTTALKTENRFVGFIGVMAQRLRLMRYLRDKDGYLRITIVQTILCDRGYRHCHQQLDCH